MPKIEIIHSAEQCEFYAEDLGNKAYVKYLLTEDAAVKQCNFVSTFVPVGWRGTGISEKLVRTAIQWAKEQGYELHASCWYAAKFIR